MLNSNVVLLTVTNVPSYGCSFSNHSDRKEKLEQSMTGVFEKTFSY